MALLVEKGSFAAKGSPGSQTVTLDDPRLTGKVIAFWMANANSLPTDGANAYANIGWAVSSSSRCSVSHACGHNNNNARARHTTTKALSFIDHNGTVIFAVDFTSFAAGEFTVNITTDGSTYVVQYEIFGGDDIEDVAIVPYTSPSSSTGNDTISTVGFQPTARIAISAGLSTAPSHTGENARIIIGATDGENEGVSAIFVDHGDHSKTSRYQRTNKSLAYCSDSAILEEAEHVSFTSDGETVNWTSSDAAEIYYFMVYFKGPRMHVGAFNTPTSAIVVPESLPFQADALLSWCYGAGATASLRSYAYMTIAGADSSINQAAYWAGSTDAYSGDSRWRGDATLFVSQRFPTDTGSNAQDEGALAGIGAKSFDVAFSTADGTARQVLYFAWSAKEVPPSTGVNFGFGPIGTLPIGTIPTEAVEGVMVGTSTSTSTATATTGSTKETTGTSASVSTATAAAGITAETVCVSVSASTATATTGSTKETVGASVSTSTAAATTGSIKETVGTSAGVSTATATTELAGTGAMAGTSTSISTAIATTGSTKETAGTSTSTSTAVAATGSTKETVGTSTSTSTAAATTEYARVTVGTSTSVSTATATVGKDALTAGASAGTSTATATTSSTKETACTSVATSTATATTSSTKETAGVSTSVATATATAGSTKETVGTSTSVSTATATTSGGAVTGDTAGTSTSVSTATATVAAEKTFAATADSVSTAAGIAYRLSLMKALADAFSTATATTTAIIYPPDNQEIYALGDNYRSYAAGNTGRTYARK